jgi:Leucine-rich repeat (LRR) protein
LSCNRFDDSPTSKQPNQTTTITKPSHNAKEAIELIERVGGKYELLPTGDLKLLSIGGGEITAEMFDVFAKQNELTEIKITNFPNFNNEILQKLSGLKKITSLTISNSSITDASVILIVDSFPLLRVLDLSRNNSLTDDSIVAISKLCDLEVLVLVYCSVSEACLSELLKLSKLYALDIRGNLSIGNNGFKILAGLPVLRSLKHLSPAIDDDGIKALTAAKNLDTLDLQDCSISDASGNEFKKIPKLSNLIIYRCTNFGSSGLLALQGKPLERLTLRDLPAIDDAGLIAFRELSTLKRIYLQELNSVSDSGMRNLIYLKELEVCEIKNTPTISDKTINSISRLSNLKTLSIIGTQITDESIDLLLLLPKLKELTLKDNKSITNNAKTKLQNTKKITTLNINN